ncbi:MAG: RNA-binding S4 domain-containing protein [Bacteroidota bacterium]|nr:RNA-binding S4 domain-containing protein [Bacteroidota bacterium]
MRIDKYLWCVRYFKTRNLATEACKKNQITINNQQVKPSKEVMPSDIITIRKDSIILIIKVLSIPLNRVGAKLVDLYRVDQTPPELIEKFELQRKAQQYYREKGEGRPTKKDRRDLELFFDNDFDFKKNIFIFERLYN